MAKFFQIFFSDDQNKKFSPNAPKTSKTRKTRFLRFRKFWNFGSRFLKFSICYHLWARKKNSLTYDFFETFFTYSEAYELSDKIFLLLCQKFSIYRKIDLKFSRFRIFGVLGVRLITYNISQNTRWSGSTYRGDGFLHQGFQNAPSARKSYWIIMSF